MIDPRTFHATAVGSDLPVALRYEQDIESFDGPLLAEFRAESGERYLYYWCDREGDVHRWMVFRSPGKHLASYLAGLVPMRNLITHCPDGFCYLVDMGAADTPKRVWYAKIGDLPADYKPTEESYRDIDTSTSRDFQDVYIAETWDYEKMTKYPRKYRQATWFLGVVGKGVPMVDPDVRSFQLTSGYVYYNAFEAMRKVLPPRKQARVEELTYASPGYLRFAVDPDIAETVRNAILGFQQNADVIVGEAKELTRWTNGRSEMSDEQAQRSMGNLCRFLHVDVKRLLKIADNKVTAANLLLSYHRKIKYLAERDAEQTEVIVGLSTDRRVAPTDEAENSPPVPYEPEL